MPGAYFFQADAREIPLADRSVQCVVTSPPYWGLRDYGVTGQIGLERTPEEYVERLVEVFREVRRVLRDDGTCWLNLGDSYFTAPAGNKIPSGISQATPKRVGLLDTYNTQAKTFPGLKPKDLVGIPWKVAFALQADGWWLRSDIVWAKPNPMPESITDRPTKAHEYVFLLTKRATYYYDAEAVKEPAAYPDGPHSPESIKSPYGQGFTAGRSNGVPSSTGRNRRTVWTIATEPYPEAHFATFPEKLVEPCILAGTSERGACPACGAPWAREVEAVSPDGRRAMMKGGKAYDADGKPLIGDNMIDAGVRGSFNASRGVLTRETLGWSPTCACPPAEPVPCRVLDPFSGSGTTVAVAERLGRVGLGVELKPDYLALARKRTAQAGLL